MMTFPWNLHSCLFFNFLSEETEVFEGNIFLLRRKKTMQKNMFFPQSGFFFAGIKAGRPAENIALNGRVLGGDVEEKKTSLEEKNK